MAAGTSSLRGGDSGVQRAPGARAAPQRPEGAANPAPIRADPPVPAANPTDPGKGCLAGAPRSPTALLAGLRSPRARQVPPPLRGRRSGSQPELCARGHLPRRYERPAADSGLDGAANPALLQGPGAPRCPSAESRARARSSGLRTAPPLCENPAHFAAEQSAASRSPPRGPAPADPRGPAPRR